MQLIWERLKLGVITKQKLLNVHRTQQWYTTDKHVSK